MTPDPLTDCERLRKALENREAIYVEQGALRVRVTNIRSNVVAQAISADIEEIPTTGFPRFIDLDRLGLTESGPLRRTITAGNQTTFSDHTWSLGNGGWSLFFGSDLLQEVVQLASQFSTDLSRNERYHRILGWLHCHKLTQGPHVQVFAPAGVNRLSEIRMTTSLRQSPPLLADGIHLEDTGRVLRWGKPLAELVETDSPNLLWRPDMVFLNWSGRTCLNGLSCDVQTGRSFGAPEPRVYHHYLPEFHWVSLLVQVTWGATAGEREQGFRDLYAHLERALGPATFSYPRPEGRLPSIHWEFRGMNVSCGIVRGGPDIYIDHEPEGYPGLKADARAIRARDGKDARVDYVAWPESDAVHARRIP
jgi:hypothetical protein